MRDPVKICLGETEMAAVIDVFRVYEVGLRSGLLKAELLMDAMKMLGLNPTEWEIVELHSEYETDGFICFRDFCQIVSGKLSSEDDDLLIKAVFKCFKETDGANVTSRPHKRDFSSEVLTFEEFRTNMKKLPEFVPESEVREMWRAVDTEDAGVIDLHQFGRMVVPSQVRHAKDKIRNRQHNYDIEELRRYMQLRMCGNFRWLSNCRAGEEEAGKEEAAEPAGDGELLLDTASTDSDKSLVMKLMESVWSVPGRLTRLVWSPTSSQSSPSRPRPPLRKISFMQAAAELNSKIVGVDHVPFVRPLPGHQY